jgi:hypothetical protein
MYGDCLVEGIGGAFYSVAVEDVWIQSLL